MKAPDRIEASGTLTATLTGSLQQSHLSPQNKQGCLYSLPLSGFRFPEYLKTKKAGCLTFVRFLTKDWLLPGLPLSPQGKKGHHRSSPPDSQITKRLAAALIAKTKKGSSDAAP
jgi:hypothetical protein